MRKARFSTWYEVFPRSCSSQAGRHGTFRDCEAWLPYIASMGFDVVYLPPIHPIGRAFRKGKNNSVPAQPDDVGSPWAIGSAEGGHKSIHPQLGTLEDFRRFVSKAEEHGLEVALDIAFQCSPDHPYARSIGSGSGPARTARSSMPRTRRRNIKTFIHWISRAPIGKRCGRN